ncbi:MAG: hypothetical protein V2A66_10615 [Pseudomonadota bacterium]
MGNLCFSPNINASDRQQCSQGVVTFDRWISPLIEIRREIGRRKAASLTDPEIENLKRLLPVRARPVEEEYLDKAKSCSENADAFACGFTAVYDNFVKLFGNPGEIGRFSGEPRSAKLTPLKSGYLVAELSTKGGERREVFLDTGSSSSGVSKYLQTLESAHFTEKNRVPIYGLKAYNTSGLAFVLGQISYSPPFVVEVGLLDKLEGTEPGKRLVALLGLDFFLQSPVEINYDSWTVTENQDVGRRLAEKRWGPVPFSIAGIQSSNLGVLILVKADVDGVSFPFAVDTGSNLSSIIPSCLLKLPKQTVRSLGGGRIADGTTVDAMAIGNITLTLGGSHIPLDSLTVTSTSDPNSATVEKNGLCGSIGLDVLARFNMIIDPETRTLFISPRKSKGEASINPSFLTERRDDGRLVVGNLTEDSTAYKSGLRSGDEIVGIDKTPASKLTPFWIVEWAYARRKRSKILIRRNGDWMNIIIDRTKRKAAR